jgi:hypothetical protein
MILATGRLQQCSVATALDNNEIDAVAAYRCTRDPAAPTIRALGKALKACQKALQLAQGIELLRTLDPPRAVADEYTPPAPIACRAVVLQPQPRMPSAAKHAYLKYLDICKAFLRGLPRAYLLVLVLALFFVVYAPRMVTSIAVRSLKHTVLTALNIVTSTAEEVVIEVLDLGPDHVQQSTQTQSPVSSHFPNWLILLLGACFGRHY